MRRRGGRLLGALVTVAVVAGGFAWLAARHDGYRVRIVMPNAADAIATC